MKVYCKECGSFILRLGRSDSYWYNGKCDGCADKNKYDDRGVNKRISAELKREINYGN